MNQRLPKIIAAHDLSGLGKASLGAIIPILSAMGTYVCPLPTAVLSTITGVFDDFSITDLTLQMQRTIDHWQTLDIPFDFLYSGFLGSPQQVDIIGEAAQRFGCHLMVDPVFADNGQLYPTMTGQMVERMRDLVCRADLITPNITEAQFLLEQHTQPTTRDQVEDWLKKLSAMGPKQVAITSCAIDGGMYVCAYEGQTGEILHIPCHYLPVNFHGTGDIFTAVLVGAIARGKTFAFGLHLAVDFVRRAIEQTIQLGVPPREGVAVEGVLNQLWESME